jgi:chromatin remodeling complex protein RSC6
LSDEDLHQAAQASWPNLRSIAEWMMMSLACRPAAQQGKRTTIMPSKAGKAEGKPASAVPAGKKPNALQKPVQPSKELAAVVGAKPLPRGEVVKKVWDYIKQHKLQNPDNGREILADTTLEAVFGQKKVTMFEMNKHLTRHLS